MRLCSSIQRLAVNDVPLSHPPRTCPADADQQCRSLLAFVNVLVNGFLPILLLVPLARGDRASSELSPPAAKHLRWLHAVDRQLERGIRWLACGGRRQPAEVDTFGVPLHVLRRLLMLATLWLWCCILES